jgi:hypothetical protein
MLNFYCSQAFFVVFHCHFYTSITIIFTSKVADLLNVVLGDSTPFSYTLVIITCKFDVIKNETTNQSRS